MDSLLDLVLAAEFMSFCYQTKSEVPPMAQPLLEKMDRLTLNQELNQLNSQLNLQMRSESGIFESVCKLARDALQYEAQPE